LFSRYKLVRMGALKRNTPVYLSRAAYGSLHLGYVCECRNYGHSNSSEVTATVLILSCDLMCLSYRYMCVCMVRVR
jgi:hypothetical protein